MILVKPISPVAADLFGLEIRWYAIAYILAFVIGLWLCKKLSVSSGEKLEKKYWDDLFTYVVVGIILGGRLGYVLFYNLPFFMENPMEIFMVWNGGMAFHGGLLGAVVAAFLFAKSGRGGLHILDKMAVAGPIGLFFGRIANFINMEVMGRATDSALGVVFAGALDQTPRHPSPLYEAASEGILLFIIMAVLWRTKLRERAGALSGVFGICYGIFRTICEQYRAPDVQIGFLFGTTWITMGMLLSLFMIAIGIFMLYNGLKTRENS
ncbi:MAG: prolipoprotein diacylglyceryl transferase [Rickettsiales bacterium]|jgi:phosphatidylglycerol:prolipoprotein diacylglycerol transferase|nr:prolipoprotein diacylglyceryl transferase [Rickettsiales bacterium]